jgi:hypothetical protein
MNLDPDVDAPGAKGLSGENGFIAALKALRHPKANSSAKRKAALAGRSLAPPEKRLRSG